MTDKAEVLHEYEEAMTEFLTSVLVRGYSFRFSIEAAARPLPAEKLNA